MSSSENTIHIAIELSTSLWLVATRLPGVAKSKMHRIDAGDTAALLTLVSDLRARTSNGAGEVIDLACCFEAGRDGFWLHRLLTEHGVPTYIVEPSSILVNRRARRARRAKTDRLDAEGLLRMLAAYLGGDRQVCSMVRVPTPEEEDAKRPHREREHLVQERTRLENRILALLATQGIRQRPSLRTWERDLIALQTGDGRPMPPFLLAELHRLRRRLVLTMELTEASMPSALTPLRLHPTTRRAARSPRYGGYAASARTSRPCLCVRCYIVRSAVASSSPAMSG